TCCPLLVNPLATCSNDPDGHKAAPSPGTRTDCASPLPPNRRIVRCVIHPPDLFPADGAPPASSPALSPSASRLVCYPHLQRCPQPQPMSPISPLASRSRYCRTRSSTRGTPQSSSILDTAPILSP